MTKNILSLAIIAALVGGCAAPKPKELDNGSALSVNNSILERQYNFVPKDSFLSSFNWTYHIVIEKTDEDFIKNDLIVKAFMLAHNATKIIIVGRESLIKDYKRYFLKNQVSAPIELQPINPTQRDFNKVNILFFSKIKMEG